MRAAAAIEGPVYIRVARPVCECFTDESTPFVPGKANIMREGGDVAIIAMGLMVAEALKAADLLAAEGIRATVVNMHTVKPLDEDAVLSVAEKCGAVVTAEEHSVIGGLGSAVAEVLAGRSGEGLNEEQKKELCLTGEEYRAARKKLLAMFALVCALPLVSALLDTVEGIV